MPPIIPNPARFFLNSRVLELIKGYPTDGMHPYYWPKEGSFDGVTEDLYYGSDVIARGDELHRTYCSGLTFEVWFKVCRDQLHLSAKELRRLKADWYVATGKRGGPVDALVPRELGMKVETIEEAQAGDFVQLWRESGSGHCVIFLQKVDGGIRYWSTQTATKGIGERTELFYGTNWVKKDELYICRAFKPEEVS